MASAKLKAERLRIHGSTPPCARAWFTKLIPNSFNSIWSASDKLLTLTMRFLSAGLDLYWLSFSPSCAGIAIIFSSSACVALLRNASLYFFIVAI